MRRHTTPETIETIATTPDQHDWAAASPAYRDNNVTVKHADHNYDALCGICQGDTTQIATIATQALHTPSLRAQLDKKRRRRTYRRDLPCRWFGHRWVIGWAWTPDGGGPTRSTLCARGCGTIPKAGRR